MRHKAEVDSLRILATRDGYRLCVDTSDGDEFEFHMSRDQALALAFSQTIGIRLQFEEGERTRAGMPERDKGPAVEGPLSGSSGGDPPGRLA